MCGIVGYIGGKKALPILLTSLEKLEYRGYDSAGVALFEPTGLKIIRASGKLLNLKNRVASEETSATVGLGHTRWATHGKPSENNAHPHQWGRVVLIHNGIIENYLELKEQLPQKEALKSETDSEILAYVLDEELKKTPSFLEAFKNVLK